MNKRIIVISNPAHLYLKNKQLLIDLKETHEELIISIEDIAMLIIDNPSISYTHGLLLALGENNCAMVVCDKKHMPKALLLPFSSHSTHTRIIKYQAIMPKTAVKSLWQIVIKSKIKAQVNVLKNLHLPFKKIQNMILKVKSGDTENYEAQAARIYWKVLFGDKFNRKRELPGLNSLLNYGYAVLRSAIARSIVGTGLHPSLGIFHKNQYNSFCLADDLLEPLRPFIDIRVYNLKSHFISTENQEITKEMKQYIIQVMEIYCTFGGKKIPITVALDLYAASIKQYICSENKTIIIPVL